MNLFKNVRLCAFIYSALMLAAIESVGILRGGKVELESKARDVYGAVLIASLSSYITEKNTNA